MIKTASTWDFIKEIYEKKFGIPPKVIDYIAVIKILKACADGYKNSMIVERTKQDRGYVNDVIVQFFHFYGWEETLDISPLWWYNKCRKSELCFEKECKDNSFVMSGDMVETAYRICRIYTKILSEIKEHYADNKTA